MKRVLFALVALLIASPAMAATVVDISCNDEGGGWVSINYKVTRGAEDPRVRAFALDISTTGVGVIDAIQAFKTGESTAASPGYGIFPGTIDLSTPETPGWGDPVAYVDDPGTAGVLGDPVITIEMGSLYEFSGEPLNAPLDDDGGNPVKLCEVRVTESCTITITEEPVRGGVVLEDPDVDPTVIIAPPCSIVCEPACWSYPHFAEGDANGDNAISFADLSPLMTAWGTTKGQPGFDACVDFNKDDAISFADLSPLMANWGMTWP